MDQKSLVYDVSISTMWADKSVSTLSGFFPLARSLGFSGVELNHQVTSAMLAGIDLHDYRIGSIHEPCPADVSTQILKERDWLISAKEEQNRRRGIESVKRSIDLAHELHGQVVVVHSGIVWSAPALEETLRDLHQSGRSKSDQYQEVSERMKESRAEAVGPCLDAAKESLMELLEYAARFQVRLGLENRYHYMDIPSLEEMGALLSLAGSEQMGFVYDVGHAQALDRLGFYSHEDWLKRYAPRMIGAHLHDVVGTTDHHAPGMGEVDFDMVAAYLPEDAFRTCELKAGITTEQVKAGLRFLVEHGCVKCL